MENQLFEIFIRGIKKKTPLPDESIAKIIGVLKVRFVKKKKET